MNITELARKLKVPTKELKEKLPELGFAIGLRAIQIPDEQAEAVIKKWNEMKQLERLRQKVEKVKRVEEEKKEREPAEKIIFLPPVITVHSLAQKLNLSIIKIINELLKNGIIATINDNLDFEIAAIIAQNLGFQVELSKEEEIKKRDSEIKEKLTQLLVEDKTRQSSRPPVVVVLGHIDHGKTSLLDKIRQTKVTEEEAGGITQHIGAYQVEVESKDYGKKRITFIDTPGHEAFNEMRSRGGQVADLAVLVIAADDKIQPQTLESIKIIQESNLPFIVAINKIDKPEADLDKIKKGLSEINLVPEDWGGKTVCLPISAKTGQGINELLEMILLMADLNKEKLKADPDRLSVGTVIESHLDPGEGVKATVLIRTGTLNLEDQVIVGDSYGRIRLMKNFQGQLLEKARPGTPVQILGLKTVPLVGDVLEVVNDLKEFKKRIKTLGKYQRKMITDQEGLTSAQGGSALGGKEKEEKKETILNIVLRADVSGSLEAIVAALEKLQTPEIKINFLKKELGDLTESDLELARTASAWLVGFQVEVPSTVSKLAQEEGIKIYLFRIIYDLIDEAKRQINALLKPEIIEHYLGKIEVLAIFRKSSQEMVVGGRVIDGEIQPKTKIRIWRQNQLMGDGLLDQLQINKQNVEKAKTGAECGIRFEGKPIINLGDIIEVYQQEKRERKIF